MPESAIEFTDTERLNYVIKYQDTQLYGETMMGEPGCLIAFRIALDVLMREYPEID